MTSRVVQTSIALLAIGLVVATGAGCLGLAMDAGLGPVNPCSSDRDCAEHGGVCDLDLGACVAGETTAESILLYVSEPEGGGSSEREFDIADVDEDGPVRFAIADTVVVRGLVADLRDSAVPLIARVTFRRLTEYEELSPDPVSTESRDRTDATEPGDTYNYEVRLVPGRYNVEVEPTLNSSFQVPDQLFYPLRTEIDVTSRDTPQVVDFEYGLDTIIVTSVVIGPEGSPIGGVRIYAYDSATERRISNVAMTGCMDEVTCGRFSIALPPDTGEFRLRLRGSDSQPLLPTMDHSQHFSARLDTNGDGALDADEIGEIAFPALDPPVLLDTVVEGQDRAGVVGPLAGATLSFQSTSTPSYVFEATATTDPDGRIVAESGLGGGDGFGIWLRPATYSVAITPPLEGEHAAGVVTLNVVEPHDGDGPADDTLLVGCRVLVEGTVVSPDGRPVPQASIEATSSEGRSFVTSTDEFGAYTLLVDPGEYGVIAAPPDQALLAWTWVQTQQFYADATLVLVVDWGTPVDGVVVRDDDEAPVGSALVEAYLIREGAADESQLVPFGRLRTGEDGGFSLLVPQEPPE